MLGMLAKVLCSDSIATRCRSCRSETGGVGPRAFLRIGTTAIAASASQAPTPARGTSAAP